MRRLTPGEVRALVRKAVDPDDAVRGDLVELVEDLMDVIENLVVADMDIERASNAADNARGRGDDKVGIRYRRTAERLTRKKQQMNEALKAELALGKTEAVDLLDEATL